MTITARQVQELRERTGAGMMECKKILTQAKGDLDKAIELLRQQGSVKAAKRAHRATSEGLVGCCLKAGVGALVELSCETDFVARTDQFSNFVDQLADRAVAERPKSVEVLKEKVRDQLTDLIAKTGENVTLKRVQVISSTNGEKLGTYIHPGSKIGVLVKMSGQKADEAVLKDIAMHIAAMHPAYLDPSEIPAEIVDKERQVVLGMDDLKNKPAEIAEKMVQGRLAKWKKEISLMDQVFIKDPSGKSSVRDFLKKVDPTLKIHAFARFQVGEES